MRSMLVCIAFLALCSCAATGSQAPDRIAAPVQIDYGPPPPADHQQRIMKAMDTDLFDGESARYQFDAPRKACAKMYTPDTYTMKVFFQKTIADTYCWAVPTRINAKNRYGAYVGWKDYVFFFKDENMLDSQQMQSYNLLN